MHTSADVVKARIRDGICRLADSRTDCYSVRPKRRRLVACRCATTITFRSPLTAPRQAIGMLLPLARNGESGWHEDHRGRAEAPGDPRGSAPPAPGPREDRPARA